MYRRSGLIILILGALAVWLLIFTPFEAELKRYTRDENNQRIRAVIVCPTPWEVLIDRVDTDFKNITDAEYCERGARTLVAGGVLTGLLALGLGASGVWRGPRPELLHLRPLSEVLPELRKTGGDTQSSADFASAWLSHQKGQFVPGQDAIPDGCS